MASASVKETKKHRSLGTWAKDTFNVLIPSRLTSFRKPSKGAVLGSSVRATSQQDLSRNLRTEPLRKHTASLPGLHDANQMGHGAIELAPPLPAKTPINEGDGRAEPGLHVPIVTSSGLKITVNFIGTLLKKLPDIVDGNPVKIAASLAKAIVEITEAVKGNMDAVDRRIASTCAQLEIVNKTLADPTTYDERNNIWLKEFKSTLDIEFTKLYQLRNGGLAVKIMNYEDEKSRIADIFERINDARIQFELGTAIAMYKLGSAIQNDLKSLLLDRLKASRRADHKYHLGPKDRERLGRAVCIPGTRVDILSGAVSWANDLSTESPSVYWLFGPAGSGKTTIAFTVARRFELTGDINDTIKLGGNFFCSRLFDETRTVTHIVPTIVYHLALRCPAFAETLRVSASFDVIDQDPATQLKELLVDPWCNSRPETDDGSSSAGRYLIVVDALDEIEGREGPEFLRALLDVIRENNLPGLKFFITSRSDPDLVARVEAFEQKKWCRLQDVEEEVVSADIAKYLQANFPHLKDTVEMARLLEFSGALFICAATLVRYLGVLSRHEQRQALASLFLESSNSQKTTLGATGLLDVLYNQILTEAFEGFDAAFRINRLRVLHTFLSTQERTSTTTVASLLFPKGPTDNKTPGFPPTTVELVDDVLSRLHAVLYTDENKLVLSYHKSFTDFIFDPDRSKEFCCSQAALHERLAEGCFRVMKLGLRFNIANIPTSFLLDRENTGLSEQVKCNITEDLAYSCRHWGFYLSAATQAKESESLVLMLSDFLELRVLFWIEAMNLLGCADLCDPTLRAIDIAAMYEQGDYTPLGRRCREAASFALYFSGSPTSSSTPHLYVSALATWHGRLVVSESWRKHFPKIPRMTTRSRLLTSTFLEINVGRVDVIAVSGSGRVIASTKHNSVHLWDAVKGVVRNVLKGHSSAVTSLAFSGDGKWIVSGSKDKTLRVWKVVEGVLFRVLKGHSGWVRSVAFSGDGSRVASGSVDMTVRVWDTLKGTETGVLKGHCGDITSVALTRDGARIASGSADKTVRVWDGRTGIAIHVLEGHSSLVTAVGFSWDGNWIASGSNDGRVRVWDASTWVERGALEVYSSWITSVALLPDGSSVIAGSTDGSVTLWDSTSSTALRVLPSREESNLESTAGESDSVLFVTFIDDGSRIISGSELNGTVRVMENVASRVSGAIMDWKTTLTSVAFSVDGTRIALGSIGEAVKVCDASSGSELGLLLGHTSRVTSLAFTGDGSRIATGSYDRTVRVWDVSTLNAVGVLTGHRARVMSVAFLGDGTRIASGSVDKTVRVWDALAGMVLSVLKGHKGCVTSVAFTEDGSRIVSGSLDMTVRVWDALGGMELRVVGHEYPVMSVAFSPDGTRIGSASYDTVRVWDASTGVVMGVLEGHSAWVTSIAFSGDGTRIVSGSHDKTVRVWDAGTGDLLQVMEGHNDRVAAVAFSGEGSRIVSGSDDETVRVWDLEPSYVNEIVAKPPKPDSRTGWIMSPSENNRLMFVPPSGNLPQSPCTLVISEKAPCSVVDLSSATLGTKWSHCYSPHS
ncbi:WD40-repeat-containing domain protein [Ephemerocybe angulata]|uniref:WD40-repeat-containing domain protein n=1 Tax=Ephemerocybe angulata TaxID=980116 RepID=A0A8H6H875_9AGAR|nr:WD40-repeat-containing domain protein [Tulosesus angulatus]